MLVLSLFPVFVLVDVVAGFIDIVIVVGLCVVVAVAADCCVVCAVVVFICIVGVVVVVGGGCFAIRVDVILLCWCSCCRYHCCHR